MALQLKKASPNRPARILIYGIEGVGKSTLGARAPKPVFLSAEGGADQLRDTDGNPVDEIQGVDSWDKACAAVTDLTNDKHDRETLVIDSADWLEKLAHQKILGNSGKSINTVEGGWGAGASKSEAMHVAFIKQLDLLRAKRSMNIIVTGHYHVKQVKDPSMMEDYDAFELKCHEKVSALWREWVDALFFARFKTFLKTDDEGTSKARALTDRSRVIYTEKQPAFQAKNRYGLKPELVFTENFWDEFVKMRDAGYSAGLSADAGELAENLATARELVSLIADPGIQATASKSVDDGASSNSRLKALIIRLRELTKGKAPEPQLSDAPADKEPAHADNG